MARDRRSSKAHWHLAGPPEYQADKARADGAVADLQHRVFGA
ncbi:MAG: hypothetical protein WBH47_03730 [Streptosporangiaceae bacterium]